MDKEVEEMQFLGVFGIIKEAFRMLSRHAKLLLAIALILVLPLAFAELAHSLVTDPIFAKIHSDEALLAAETSEKDTADAGKTKKDLYVEWLKLLSMFLGYLAFVFAFSLLSTAALVYSVACIYIEKDVGFVKSMRAIPRVWRRLMFTLFWVYLVIFAFHVVFLFFALIIVSFLGAFGISISALVLLAGLVFLGMEMYLSVYWHLANVISVMEDRYGLEALKKSVKLVKGKMNVGYWLVLIYMLCTTVIAGIFSAKVKMNELKSKSLGARIGYGSVLVIALTLINLVFILVQSLFYFSCKSYHHESIDRLALSDQLDAYLGDYVPLRDPSIPMESFEA